MMLFGWTNSSRTVIRSMILLIYHVLIPIHQSNDSHSDINTQIRIANIEHKQTNRIIFFQWLYYFLSLISFFPVVLLTVWWDLLETSGLAVMEMQRGRLEMPTHFHISHWQSVCSFAPLGMRGWTLVLICFQVDNQRFSLTTQHANRVQTHEHAQPASNSAATPGGSPQIRPKVANFAGSGSSPVASDNKPTGTVGKITNPFAQQQQAPSGQSDGARPAPGKLKLPPGGINIAGLGSWWGSSRSSSSTKSSCPEISCPTQSSTTKAWK